jgi:hypothetical protein
MSLTKTAGSGSESISGSISQRLRSADLVPHQNVRIWNTARGYSIFSTSCEKNVSIEREKFYNTSVL